MRTRDRSSNMLKFENKLFAAYEKLTEARDLWMLALEADEQYAAGICYPSYLPSFEKFLEDLDFWITHLSNRDNQA